MVSLILGKYKKTVRKFESGDSQALLCGMYSFFKYIYIYYLPSPPQPTLKNKYCYYKCIMLGRFYPATG